MKHIILLAICIFSLMGFSQKSINDYEYLVLPLQYDFLKGKDQFRLNSLTRYLFKDEGFTVFFDEEQLPEDLFKDRCKAMYGDVKKVKSGFLKTKLQIEIKDCYGNMLAQSDIGSTKEKKFDKAYAIALREAFESIKFLNYRYSPNTSKETTTVASKTSNVITEETKAKEAELARLQKEVEQLKLEKEAKAKAEKETAAEAERLAKLRVEKSYEVAKKKMDTLKDKEVATNEKEALKEAKKATNPSASEPTDLLYAQAIEGGFQLVDAEPKKVMILLKTAAPNVFSVKGKDAIVFKEDGQWIYSENTGETTVKKILQIKF